MPIGTERSTLKQAGVERGAANVFSVDVESDLVDQARARLAELGYHPTLVVADGAAGLPEHAPFDRIIATCSVPAIPWPWSTSASLISNGSRGVRKRSVSTAFTHSPLLPTSPPSTERVIPARFRKYRTR